MTVTTVGGLYCHCMYCLVLWRNLLIFFVLFLLPSSSSPLSFSSSLPPPLFLLPSSSSPLPSAAL